MGAMIGDLRFDAADGKVCRDVAKMLVRGGRTDADNAVLFARAVETEIAAAVEMDAGIYPLAEGDMLSLDELGDGVVTWYQHVVEKRAVVSWGHSGNMPYASLGAIEVTGRLENLEGGYKWSTEEERRAGQGRVRLVPMLSDASAEAHTAKWDETLAWGKENLRLNGLYNHPNISVIATPLGVSGFPDWPRKTADEILNDVNALINSIPQRTQRKRRATDVHMSPRMWEYVTQTRVGPGDGEIFIIELIEKAHRNVTFSEVRYLERADERSQAQLPSGDAMFAFDRTRVSKVRSFLFRTLAPQRVGLETVVPAESKIGGIKILEPLTLARMDGLFLS